MKKIDAIFLDRDGVINIDYGYVGSIDRFVFCDGAISALKKLYLRGCKLFIVTNQSGIYRNYYTEQDFLKVMNYLKEQLKRDNIYLSGVRHCPHDPNQKCGCRKPKSKMVLDLVKIHNLNPNRSIMIGDNCSDIECAHNANIATKVLIAKKKMFCKIAPDYIFPSLSEFVDTLDNLHL